MPQQPPAPPQADRRDVLPHEPAAFESDLERHRASADEVYGSHGVQPEPGESAFRPGAGRSSRGLSRVGDRRR